jgi:hypothetical protein
MIYTPKEYSKSFTIGRKKVSVSTIIRRCKMNMLPYGHKARRLPGGVWAIEVREEKVPAT